MASATTNTGLQSSAALVGRFLMSSIFIISGVHKLLAWSDTASRMESEGMVAVPLLLAGAVVCELGGGLSVLIGYWTRVGAAVLIVFLIPTTLIFHDFWTYSGQEREMQMINFMKNLAILGGMLTVWSFGPGRYSADRFSFRLS